MPKCLQPACCCASSYKVSSKLQTVIIYIVITNNITPQHFYPIGTLGQLWGAAELSQWRARQVRQRSYASDLLGPIEQLRDRFDVSDYGEAV